jgi:hypothetical protein
VEEAGKVLSRGRQFKTNLKHNSIQETLSETVYKNRDKDSSKKFKALKSKDTSRSDLEVNTGHTRDPRQHIGLR